MLAVCARHGVEAVVARHVHRRRRAARARRRPHGAGARHPLPARRPAAAHDDGRAARTVRATPVAAPACADPAGDAAGAAGAPQHRVEGTHHPPLRPRDPWRHRGAPARRRRRTTVTPTAWCWPSPPTTHGLAIGIGVNPWFGITDPERMAHAVVDEAIRNVVAVGADPELGGAARQLQLGRPAPAVHARRAGRGRAGLLRTRPPRTGAPFVSGKDSLNNEYLGSDGARHAVPPTLVITAIAHHARRRPRRHPRPQAAPATCWCWWATPPAEFGGSHFTMVTGDGADSAGARARCRTARRALPGAAPASCAPGACAAATTSAKAAWPWHSPRWPSAAASAPPRHPAPRRPHHGAVQRVQRPVRVRGGARRPRVVPRRARRAGSRARRRHRRADARASPGMSAVRLDALRAAFQGAPR